MIDELQLVELHLNPMIVVDRPRRFVRFDIDVVSADYKYLCLRYVSVLNHYRFDV